MTLAVLRLQSNGWKGSYMHNLISAVSRRTAGLAAGVVLAGGMAGGVLLLPGTASAQPLITTTTAITNVTQSSGSNGTTLDVFVTVTPTGSVTSYPTGTVKVTDGVSGSGCYLTLVQDGPNSSVATGNCDITPPLSAGTYTLQASYGGNSSFGGSTSSNDTVTIGAVPVFTADSPATTANRGENYSYNFAASGNPTPTYSLSGAPGWLSINSSTGAVSGTVPGGISSFTYSVVASNSEGSATAGPFTVTVGHRGGHPGGHASLSTSLSCTSPVRSGSHGTCTLYVTDNGSGSAQDVTGQINLPSQLTADFCGHNWGWGWFNNYGCSISGNTATEDLGTVRSGQTKSLTVTFTAQSTHFLWGWGHQSDQWVKVTGSASAQSQGFWGWFGGGSTSYASTWVKILPAKFFW
jgi:hypothetical protein